MTGWSGILDVGDALISFGDFLENNKTLQPSPYVQEWWLQYLERALGDPVNGERILSVIPIDQINAILTTSLLPTAEEAFAISEAAGIPLNPYYTPRFDRLSVQDLLALQREHGG